MTQSGAIVTETVTSTPAPYVNPDTITQSTPQRKGVSGGTIAGAVVGSLLGVALLLLGACLLWRRRKNKKNDPEARSSAMTRNASVLSKAGLLSSSHGVEAEKTFDDTPHYQPGTASQRQSALYGGAVAAFDSGDSPASGPYATSGRDSRRNSRPLVYDQRLNPAALMQNWELNGSRTSVNTMQDQRDYSRPLNIANPDMHD